MGLSRATRVGVEVRTALQKSRSGLGAGLLCLAIVAGTMAAPSAMAIGTGRPLAPTTSHSANSTGASAPASQRSAVEPQLGAKGDEGNRSPGSADLQLAASYSPAGAHLDGAGFGLRLGLGSLGRTAQVESVAPTLARAKGVETYGTHALTESFRSSGTGIEQSFHVARRPAGSGSLVLHVPVTGLSATTSGQAISLRDRRGQVRATYSGLHVTDAGGKSVPASMRAVSRGSAIAIAVHDVGVTYPLNIDPTWTSEVGTLYAVDRTSVFPVDLASGTLGTRMNGGNDFFDGAITPNGQDLYVVDYNEQDVIPFNLVTDTAGSAINVGLNPVSVVVAPNGQTVYTINEQGLGNSICPITVATNAKGTCVSFPVLGGPMAISPNGNTLYVYSGNGNLYPVSTATLTAASPISVPTAWPSAIAITPNGQTAYLLSSQDSQVVPVNLVTSAAETPIPWVSGAKPLSIAIAPNGQTAYVVNNGNETVTPINLSNNTTGTPIDFSGLSGNNGYGLDSIVITSDGLTAYVQDSNLNVIPITLSTGSIGTLIAANDGDAPSFLVMAPATSPSVARSELQGGSNPAEACFCSQHQAGDPIDTATGNFWHTSDDLSVPGRGAALDLSRTYNSDNATVSGPFGNGWNFSYGMNLAIDANTGVATISQEDGSPVTFNPNGSGGFTAPSNVLATLVPNGDGTYTFTRKARSIFTFSATGQLTAESDLNDYVTALSYNASHQLTTVTDPAGRTLTFGYTNGLITTATDTTSGRSLTYGYTGSNLTSVTDPDGGVTTFGYNASNQMTTMLDPNQHGSSSPQPLTNVYDSSGRVTSQTDPMGRTTTFDYTSIPGATKVTNPTGTPANPTTSVTLDQYSNQLTLSSETTGYGTTSAATWHTPTTQPP